jgi:hypothetical protein
MFRRERSVQRKGLNTGGGGGYSSVSWELIDCRYAHSM